MATGTEVGVPCNSKQQIPITLLTAFPDQCILLWWAWCNRPAPQQAMLTPGMKS